MRLSNPGRLPQGFDPARSGGSGLELILLLLPPAGASLDWAQEDGEVVATLRLAAPAVSPVSSTAE